MGLADFAFSLQMRDTIQRLMRESIDTLRPRYRYATVNTIDRATRKCTVTFNGETNPVIVNMGSIQPAAVNQIVRIEGIGTDKFITDVIGDPYLYSLATTSYVDTKDTARGTTTTNLVNARTVVPSTGWVTVATLGGGWVYYDVPNLNVTFPPVRYRKLSNGQVEIQGLIKDGANAVTLFTLPAGFRPNYKIIISTLTNNGPGRFDIQPNGDVNATAIAAGSWLSLTCTFWADQ